MLNAQIVPLRGSQPKHRLEQEPSLIPINSPYELCAYMRNAIQTSGMKYKVIAGKADCHPNTVSRLADGTTKDPQSSTCVKILFALGKNLYIGS